MPKVHFKKRIFNSTFYPLLKNTDRYLLLYGGRGSGKSVFAAQKLIIRCLKEKYFRYILLRKTYESIKDSQYQTIKDLVNEYNLDAFFTFRKSPLEIECINGNKFIAKGLDKPEKTKSIKDASGIWYEEGNEITEEDFISSTTSIRTVKANYIQEIFSFNPEANGDYKDFWIYKKWFKGKGKSFSDQFTLTIPEYGELSYNYTAHHSTYHDNKGNLTDEFIANIEWLKDFRYYYYLVYGLGEWGNKDVNSPFLYAFEQRHISDKAQYNKGQTIYLSFDFNISPMAIILGHKGRIEGRPYIHYFDEIAVENANVYKGCDMIKTKYPLNENHFFVTGDRTSKKREITQKENSINAWTIIQNELKLVGSQIRLPRNPDTNKAQILMNSIFARHNEILINPRCSKLISDCRNVEVDKYNKIRKANRNDPNQQSDFLDALKYDIHTWHGDFVRNVN